LLTVAIAAIAKKIAAVIPPASATISVPLRSPAATVSIGPRTAPQMNVKPNSAATPHPLLRSAVTTNSEPNIAAIITSGVAIGCSVYSVRQSSCMPANAPTIVGSSVSASSQYVLRRTRFESTATATCPRLAMSPYVTGSRLRSIVPPPKAPQGPESSR
jgi:hypothetical protein